MFDIKEAYLQCTLSRSGTNYKCLLVQYSIYSAEAQSEVGVSRAEHEIPR